MTIGEIRLWEFNCTKTNYYIKIAGLTHDFSGNSVYALSNFRYESMIINFIETFLLPRTVLINEFISTYINTDNVTKQVAWVQIYPMQMW